MQSRPLGSGGLAVPVVGQGTWMMERDRRSAVAALRRGVELGMTHIDTAEMYGSGRVEEIVAEAVAGVRDRVFLASKVLPSNASRDGTVRACEASLRRLGTDRLDLYLLHWPSRHPLAETFAAFEDLAAAGKILRWGVSNFDAEDVEAAVSAAGPGRIACNQVLYHLGERAIEHAVIPACERHGIAVVGYSPFGQGRFPRRSPALEAVAARRGATARQVALAFLVRRAALFTIPKSSSVRHVEENAGGGDLLLDGDDIAAIEEAFPLGPPSRSLPML